MILVGDSGSTKTDWRLIQGSKILQQYHCKGLNPHFHSSDSIFQEVKACFGDEIPNQIEEIHFYGSGSSSNL